MDHRYGDWSVGMDGSLIWVLVGWYEWIKDMELGLVGIDGSKIWSLGW